MVRRGDMLGTSDVIEVLAIELVGIVPEDEGIIISTNRGMPAALDEKALAGQAFRNIARRIMGEDVPFMNLRDTTSIFSRLIRLIRQ